MVMAKFKYNGDHPDMSCFGLTFRAGGENVEAETDNNHICRKLRGNSHFDEVEGEVAAGSSGPDAPTDVNEMSRQQLQEYAAEKFQVDIPMGNKAEMLEAVTDLITRNS
jgi:hypothetical protein